MPTAVKVSKKLPAFIEPMLAKPGQPFDSDEYLYEIKWDGVRALAFIESDGYRVMNRRQADLTGRYPEFAPLAQLPAGTVLDGEIVVFHEGRPDFALLQSREHSRTPLRVKALSRSTPANFMAFDLLYEGYESLLAQPLIERRQRLQRMLEQAGNERLAFSDCVIGKGSTFFKEVCQRGLEGVVAKRIDSRYVPGKRLDSWIKVKRNATFDCAIIGFTPKGTDDFRNLILAMAEDGELRYAGKVGTGFDMKTRDRLNQLLWSRLRRKPIVPCKLKGKWVEPGLYCRVSCMERTVGGEFRAPVFEGLEVE
jgi:DNA ligase D-like protein (predicted ligase)